jgi:hypothetical protein
MLWVDGATLAVYRVGDTELENDEARGLKSHQQIEDPGKTSDRAKLSLLCRVAMTNGRENLTALVVSTYYNTHSPSRSTRRTLQTP